MLFSGNHKDLAPSLETIGAAFAISGEDALKLAERARQAIAENPVSGCADQPIEVTASFGVATANGKDATPEALVDRADKALYRAKELGRNRVVRES